MSTVTLEAPAVVEGLTAEDVSYLRRADDVYAVSLDGQNYLRACKRGDYRDKFSDDKRVDIPVQGSGGGDWFGSLWQFDWAQVKRGDLVSLSWDPDAFSNGYTKQAIGSTDAGRFEGLHADAVYVVITRGRRTVRMLGTVSVCADNTARMCRGAEARSF